MIKYRLCYNLDHIINRDSSSNATTKATFGAIWYADSMLVQV